MTTDRTDERSAAAHGTARLPNTDNTPTRELIAELCEALEKADTLATEFNVNASCDPDDVDTLLGEVCSNVRSARLIVPKILEVLAKAQAQTGVGS